jgi:hypothetical protein
MRDRLLGLDVPLDWQQVSRQPRAPAAQTVLSLMLSLRSNWPKTSQTVTAQVGTHVGATKVPCG